MKYRHLWLALFLVLATNALVLTGVARNRTGAPEAILTLTERELALNTSLDREENSGIELTLNWNQNAAAIKKWFDRAKLGELGIEIPDKPGTSDAGRWPLPKKAFIVLEYEGEAWQRFKKEKEQELLALEQALVQGKTDEEQMGNQGYWLEREIYSSSRLVPVDAGLDPRQLRRRYPDNQRYLIVSALLRATIDHEKDQEIPHGMIDSLLVRTLHVPRELHTPLLDLAPEEALFNYRHDQPDPPPAPRYEVEVRWGRRYEPWVTDVRRIDDKSNPNKQPRE